MGTVLGRLAVVLVGAALLASCMAPPADHADRPRGAMPSPAPEAVFTHRFDVRVTILGGPKRATLEATSPEDCMRLHRAVWSALRESRAELSACARNHP